MRVVLTSDHSHLGTLNEQKGQQKLVSKELTLSKHTTPGRAGVDALVGMLFTLVNALPDCGAHTNPHHMIPLMPFRCSKAYI